MIRPASLHLACSRFARPSEGNAYVAMLVPVVALAFIVGTAGFARADEGANEKDQALIKYRQSVMSTIGTNMGAIGDILKNQLDMPGAIENHATQMATAAALIAPAFKQRIIEGATDAKPEIWRDWEKFERAITAYENAARRLATAAAGSDPKAVGVAMRGLGKRCGGCHKPFRKPKEESYKNR